MRTRNFGELINARWVMGLHKCVGLDSVLDRLPTCVRGSTAGEKTLNFNTEIIRKTHDLVAAYKINPAFYCFLGGEKDMVIRDTIAFIHKEAPSVPVILDGKYGGGISEENEGNSLFAFEYLKADAVTLNPLPGRSSFKPFLEREDKGLFFLCHTSGNGAEEFQDLRLSVSGPRIYQVIALHIINLWNINQNCGLVVGGTHPNAISIVRNISPYIPLLIPGIGTQKGNEQEVARMAKRNFILSSSRSIIFASSENNFAETARKALMHTDKNN